MLSSGYRFYTFFYCHKRKKSFSISVLNINSSPTPPNYKICSTFPVKALLSSAGLSQHFALRGLKTCFQSMNQEYSQPNKQQTRWKRRGTGLPWPPWLCPCSASEGENWFKYKVFLENYWMMMLREGGVGGDLWCWSKQSGLNIFCKRLPNIGGSPIIPLRMRFFSLVLYIFMCLLMCKRYSWK